MSLPIPLIDDCDGDCLHPEAVASARDALARATSVEGVAGLFAVLGDPTRIRVLAALVPGELCVHDLAAATGVNRTTISHQLRVLRTNRLVRRRREGRTMFYALDDDHVLDLLGIAGMHAVERAS